MWPRPKSGFKGSFKLKLENKIIPSTKYKQIYKIQTNIQNKFFDSVGGLLNFSPLIKFTPCSTIKNAASKSKIDKSK